jgi:acetyltransferase-like isoleucine patch superfamily enzyme
MRFLRKAFRQRHTIRARVLLALLKLQAKARGATVEMDVDPDFRVGRRVVFRVAPRTHNRMRIGSGSVIRDDVVVTLKGGTLDWGDDIEIRSGTIINLAGTFRLEGRNIISYGNIIHCSESISMDECASTTEYVSIIDSTHHHDGESDFFYENTTAAPITIGANVWVCNKASVLMGTTIGANSVIASHAVVNRDVPEATVVGGLPARVIAPRSVGGGALRYATKRPAVVSANE